LQKEPFIYFFLNDEFSNIYAITLRMVGKSQKKKKKEGMFTTVIYCHFCVIRRYIDSGLIFMVAISIENIIDL
jgi:hypothetical protein